MTFWRAFFCNFVADQRTTPILKSYDMYKWNAQHQPFFVSRYFFFLVKNVAAALSLYCTHTNTHTHSLSFHSLLKICKNEIYHHYYSVAAVTLTFFSRTNEIHGVSTFYSEHHKRTMKWTIWKLKLKQPSPLFICTTEKKNGTTWK